MESDRCHHGVCVVDDDPTTEERCILREGHQGEHEFHAAARRAFGRYGLDKLGRPASPPVLAQERQHLSYRGESSDAGVVTKRIDRVDGAREVSFYAIGPKRARHAEAVADLGRLVTDPSDLRDVVFTCPACGDPGAHTTEPDVDIHAGASYSCDQCGAQVHFEALTREEYLALIERLEREDR